MSSQNLCFAARLTLASAALAVLALSAEAQATRPSATHQPKKSATWHKKGDLRLGATHDDNVYLLTTARKASLDAQPSVGRFADMPGSTDLVTAIRAAGEAKGPGLGGREMTIGGDARYEYYTTNTKRSNATIGLTASQAVTSGGRLHLRGELTPTYFFRDYLADAVDANGDGVIQSAERVYAPGTYSDAQFTVGYRQRLASSASGMVGVALDVQAGVQNRNYIKPFEGRSMHGPVGNVNMIVDFANRVSADVGYERASLSATPTPTVLLLNEPDFNRDFNGNGTTTDLRVRSLQNTDFSRVEQTAGLRLRALLAPSLDARVSLAHRWRNFSSSQPYDVYNNTRHDRRDQVGVTVGKDLWERTRVEVGAITEMQKLSRTLRPTAAAGEVNDYSRNRLLVNWSYKL